MKLSLDEDLFLRRWVYDEAHHLDEEGPAKRLQLEHRAIPADLAVTVAAWVPDLAEQERIAAGAPPAPPAEWPWTGDSLRTRLAEARQVLATRRSAIVARSN
jgi:hypothetical protein